jgi:acyl-[acyl-carrier-protein]-phospholipid O-acyltransferase/long-chain-fatty-acid--[acyl-carrier-protein] ligase
MDNSETKKLKYGLFLKRRFLPVFLATFLGGFNDNVLRSGLTVLLAYAATKHIELPTRPEILVTVASALLMIPLILFSSIAGPLADKYEKSRLVVYTKIAELGIMATAFYGFSHQNIYLLMVLLFISGTHTCFYGPIKFSILPDHLSHKELLAANGFMAGGSYLALLFGLITGGLLEEYPHNAIGYALMGVASVGFIASLFIPKSHIAHPETKISFNLWRGTREIVSHACKDQQVMHSIAALSWFLLIASVFMSQFANYAQAVVHANNEVYILFLTVFSIGIVIGSLLCDTLLKGEITPKMTPFAGLGISLFTYLMVVATPAAQPQAELLDAHAFLMTATHWVMLGCMLMVALCGGIYIVPLYAILQSHTPTQYRSRIMAASNLNDALFMTSAAVVCTILLSFRFAITDLFLIVATLNIGVVLYARRFFT